MNSKRDLLIGISLLVILSVFIFKNIFSSNKQYLGKVNSDELTQEVSKSALSVSSYSQMALNLGDSSASLQKAQTLEKKTSQEKSKQHNSEVLNNTKKGSYQLSEPQESIELFNSHILVEHCLNYIDTINRYGSFEKAINHLTNETGHEYNDLKTQFEESDINCSEYNGKTEDELLVMIDNYLIESAALGNERASSKYASMLSQRAIFGKDLYTHQKRLGFHRKSIAILSQLSEKGHTQSMLLLSMLLSDYVNFPETYDGDESRRQIDIYESLTRENMSKLK